MVSEDIVKINLLEVILRSLKNGSKYPYELSYLSGTLANILKPSDKKRDVSFDENQLGSTVIADLKDLYNSINIGQSWRGIRPVIAICNPDGDGITDLIKPECKESLIRDYPLVGSALGSVNSSFGSKDECIIIGNYENEPLMRTLRSSLNPKLKINYDIPNGFITRALYDLSEQAVAEIGKYTERYGNYFYVARSTSQGYKVTTNFYYSQTAVPNEVIKREFKFNCISTDPQYGSAPFEVRSQVIQGENNPKIINVNTNKVVGFSQNTHLMDQVFSASDDSEFIKLFSDAIDRTYKFGNTSMVYEDKQLNFAEVDGNVLVEDPANQDLTQIYPNPANPNDMQMQALQVHGQPTMDPTVAPGAMAQGVPTQGNLVPVMDPATGQPIVDPNTGQPLMEDPTTGMLIDPATGQPMIDPTTGQPIIDPNFLAQQGQAAGPQMGMQQQPAQQPPVTPQQVPNIPTQQPNPMMMPNQQFSNLNTDLMNKLFSAPNDTFAYEFTDAFNAARKSGHAILVNGNSITKLYSEDGKTVVADDKGEQTIVKANEAGQLELEPGENEYDEIPYDDITEDVDDAANPDHHTTIDEGVQDANKAGLEGNPNDSFTGDEDKAFSAYFADLYNRAFSGNIGDKGNEGVGATDIKGNLDRNQMNPESREDIDTGIMDKNKAGLEGNPSKSLNPGKQIPFDNECDKTFSDEDIINDITEKANLLQQAVDELNETQDPELAENIQELADDLKEEAGIFEGDADVDTEDVRIQCNKWVKLCSDVISENRRKIGSLEYKTVSFSQPKDNYGNRFAPSNNFINMLYSGTELLDDPEINSDVVPVDAPEVDELPEVNDVPEVECDNCGGDITVTNDAATVTVDSDGDVDVDVTPKSFSNTTKTFAQGTASQSTGDNKFLFVEF